MKPFHITKASVIIVIQLLVLSFLTPLSLGLKSREAASETYFLSEQDDSAPLGKKKEKDFIRWVDFTVPAEVMEKAFRLDINTCRSGPPGLDPAPGIFRRAVRRRFFQVPPGRSGFPDRSLKNGTSMDTLAEGPKYYPYYKEAYGAVLGGMVGYFDRGRTGRGRVRNSRTGAGFHGRDWIRDLGHKNTGSRPFPPSPETSHTATMTTSASPVPTATSASIWATI